MEYFIEESGDPENGYTWNIMLKEDDRLRCIAQCLDEVFAERIKSALMWQDALGSGMMKLAMDGIAIDANTGKVWERPKGLKAAPVQFTKARKPTKKPRG